MTNGVNGVAKPIAPKFKTPDSLPSLDLPEDPCWYIFVTVVEAVDDLSVRLVGPEYSDALDALADEMEAFYAVNHPLVVPKVKKRGAKVSVENMTE